MEKLEKVNKFLLKPKVLIVLVGTAFIGGQIYCRWCII